MRSKIKTSGESGVMRFISKEKDIADQIINNSRSMISVINRDYIYEKVNSTFCNAHMVVNDSIVGKSLGEVWGKDTFENVIKQNIDKCFSGKIVRYEAFFNTPSLGSRYFEVVFRPVSFEGGKVTRLLAETFDIDDLKRSERTIIEKEEEFRKFETNLPVGFLRCDVNGKILHVNKPFLKIIGCKDEKLVLERNIRDFYSEDCIFEIQYIRLLENNTIAFGRVYLKNLEGTEIPCRISGFLALDGSGNPSYIDFAIEDSTRELMLENRLLQAQKLETIGALAGGIAHDFNNILATISGYAELLQDDLPQQTELSEKVSKIQGAVLKARSITNQILTFSRQVEQEKVPVNVSAVLKETIGFVKSALPSNIIIKSRIIKNGVSVYADPTQLFRVFLNLMTNAMQAMEDNGGSLSVTQAVVEGKCVKHDLNKGIVADEYVLLTFKDTGKGMDQSLKSRIFEPFFTTREVGKGTGLGLSVTHGIVAEMEGEILVSSKKGKGSVFYVYLPVSKEYADTSVDQSYKKRILLIKGNKYESSVLSMALENSGYELISVSDHGQLGRIMSDDKGRPDLLIYMSDSRQIEPKHLFEVVRQQKEKIPCILITEPNLDLLEEKLLTSGIIKQHLIKPVSLKEIRNAIQESLK
ncbi:MAG TPA: ATP-binding protein [Bacteroidales bacterium]|nr:ATP-binding protein [Bacteroidales bacterium]HPT20569.1 ATP-binding protein [Bacteroidales bacterium]